MSNVEKDKNPVTPNITISTSSINIDTRTAQTGGATNVIQTEHNLDESAYDTALNENESEDDDETPITTSELDVKIQALIESLGSLDEYEKLITSRAQSKAEENVEKRKIRYKRNKINEQLKQLCFKREMQKVTTSNATPRKKTCSGTPI